MPGKPQDKFTLWPQDHEPDVVSNVIEMYKRGFAGATYNPAERERMLAAQTYPDGESAASHFGFAGAGEGKLSLAFKPAYDHWTKCWPCPGQTTGDCVSHAGKNCAIVLIGVEASQREPDPETGIIEGFPEVSEEAEAQGVVACEPIYGFRGHTGQGADCGRLQRYMTEVGGILLRQNYPDLHLDLTRYDATIGMRWGGSGTPDAVNQVGKKHQIRQATDCKGHEVCRDFLAVGYPIWVCSGYGWSNHRDENGYSVRQGSWGHSWMIAAYDDRAITKKKYGFPLALYFHDWGKWNSGGRKILGTDILIPEGCMWIDARLLDHCDTTAMSNTNGWKAKKLLDYASNSYLN